MTKQNQNTHAAAYESKATVRPAPDGKQEATSGTAATVAALTDEASTPLWKVVVKIEYPILNTQEFRRLTHICTANSETPTMDMHTKAFTDRQGAPAQTTQARMSMTVDMAHLPDLLSNLGEFIRIVHPDYPLVLSITTTAL